jgi:hypothetical protein
MIVCVWRPATDHLSAKLRETANGGLAFLFTIALD